MYPYFLLFSLQNVDCGYSLEPPLRAAVLACMHNLCFEQKREKYHFSPVKKKIGKLHGDDFVMYFIYHLKTITMSLLRIVTKNHKPRVIILGCTIHCFEPERS